MKAYIIKKLPIIFHLYGSKCYGVRIVIRCWPPVASFTKEVNQRLAKRPLKTNGHLANRVLTSLVKEAIGELPHLYGLAYPACVRVNWQKRVVLSFSLHVLPSFWPLRCLVIYTRENLWPYTTYITSEKDTKSGNPITQDITFGWK